MSAPPFVAGGETKADESQPPAAEPATVGRDHPRNEPPVLELPFDFPRGTAAAQAGVSRSRELPGSLGEALKACAWAEEASLLEVLLAAWQTLLQRWTNQHDIVVGSPVHSAGE